MIRSALIAAIILISSFSAIAGGGWTHKKGTGYFKLGQSFLQSDKFYNPEGEIIDIRTTGYYATSVYGEYGITDRLEAIAYIPFFTRNTLNSVKFNQSGREIPGDEMNSVGDIDLSVKYAIIQNKKWVLAGTLLLDSRLERPKGERPGFFKVVTESLTK